MVLRRHRPGDGTTASDTAGVAVGPPPVREPAAGPPGDIAGRDDDRFGAPPVPPVGHPQRRRRDRIDRRIERRVDRRRTRASSMLTTRIVLVGVLGIGLSRLGARAFDESVPELLAVPVLITVVALVARRWRILVRALTAGGAVAASTVLVGLIGGASWSTLFRDLADGPRRLVTTEWPSPLDAGVAMTVALALAVVVAVAADLAGRPRFHTAPLAAIGLGFAGALAVAAPVRPSTSLLAGMAIVAVLLLLARPGDDPRARVRHLTGERSLAVTLIAVVVAGLVVATVVAWADRADPRREVAADQTLSLLFPVQQMIALREVEPPIDLYRITDRSSLAGPSLPTRWRLAALGEFDGQRWLPDLTLRPIGGRLSADAAPTSGSPPVTYELEILTDDISVVPLPGAPIELDADDVRIQTDADRTVVLLEEAPEPGTTAVVTAEVAPSASDAESAAVGRRPVDEISKGFVEEANAIAGSGTLVERLEQIEATMQDEWLLDSDAPGGGLQLALMNTFVQDTQRGTREQFVTAFIFFARSLGIDARIATGFIVPPDRLGSPLTLTSADAAVWPEVRIEGLGWVPYEPVPAEETTDEDEPPPPPSEQSPAAAQPPIPPPTEQGDETPPEVDEPISEIIQSGFRTWVIRVGVVAGVTLLPVLLLCGTILLLKWRRRRRRLQAADPAARIVGAWANTTDSLVDAGLTIAPAWTDDRIAEHAVGVAPTIPHEMRRLAAAATAMTFGNRAAGALLVDDAVATAHSVDDAIRADRTRWERVRWRLSLRSLRRATRSPVQA